MRSGWGRVTLTAVPAAIWGSTYAVSQLWLPPDRPLFVGTVRALPIGIAMVLWLRRLPRGSWWWRSFVLGGLNIGLIYALLFVAAYRLPSGLGSAAVGLSPLVVALLAWLILGNRPLPVTLLAGVGGLTGVLLVVLSRGVHGSVDPVGLLAAAAVVVSSSGFVLTKRWAPPEDVIVVTSWQLVAAGLILLPIALVVEGPPPAITLSAGLGLAYLAIIGSGLAYTLWFQGLARLGPSTASIIGLVNPAVGVLLGLLLLHESFGALDAIGLTLILGSVLLGQERLRRVVVARWSRRPVHRVPVSL